MSACTCHDRVLELEDEVERLREALSQQIVDSTRKALELHQQHAALATDAQRDLIALHKRVRALEAKTQQAAEDLLPAGTGEP